MRMLLCSVVFCVTLFCGATQGEVFTALADLENVLWAEKELASQLRGYIEQQEERINYLKNVADDYERHANEALKDSSFIGNPVNAFLLVKRFTNDWHKIQEVIKSNGAEEFLEELSPTLAYFPTDEDMTGAATALLRLQDTYELSTDKLARGEIQGVKYSPSLSADECYEIGRKAYNEGDFYHTILWMSEANNLLDHEHTPTIERSVLLDYLSFAVYSQGNIRAALNLTNEWLALEPNHQRAQSNKRYYEEQLAEKEALRFKRGDDGSEQQYEPEIEEFKNERIIDDYRKSLEFENYEAMCRGETVVERYDTHRLTCQYKRHHPMFYINPLREETMNLKPWIVIYHNLLYDEEIEMIKKTATPKLKRATVQNPQTGKLETAFYRVSKSAWLRDDDAAFIRRVSERVNAATNLTMETAEELQVVNYGIGGHYEPHFDFARKRESATFDSWRGNRIATAIFYKEESATFDNSAGNRIATAIFYMSDVEAGGATVFTNIDVKLWPEKGALGFWYNLLQNGEGDYETRHAACPVLTGSKWVCNKWIHERGQEFTRPCDLSPSI